MPVRLLLLFILGIGLLGPVPEARGQADEAASDANPPEPGQRPWLVGYSGVVHNFLARQTHPTSHRPGTLEYANDLLLSRQLAARWWLEIGFGLPRSAGARLINRSDPSANAAGSYAYWQLPLRLQYRAPLGLSRLLGLVQAGGAYARLNGLTPDTLTRSLSDGATEASVSQTLGRNQHLLLYLGTGVAYPWRHWEARLTLAYQTSLRAQDAARFEVFARSREGHLTYYAAQSRLSSVSVAVGLHYYLPGAGAAAARRRRPSAP